MFTGDALLDFVIGMSLILAYFICRHVGEGFAGRIGRRRFLIRQIIMLIAPLVLIPVVFIPVWGTLIVSPSFALKIILPLLIIPTACFIGWFNITTDVRRLHDMNLQGGWFFFLQGIVLVGVILDILMVKNGIGIQVSNMQFNIAAGLAFVFTRLFLLLVPGSQGGNRFGYNHDRHYIF